MVVGVEDFVATLFLLFWLLRYCETQRPGPTLRVGLRETGSATNMQLVLHKRLAGVSRSHFSKSQISNGGLVDLVYTGLTRLRSSWIGLEEDMIIFQVYTPRWLISNIFINVVVLVRRLETVLLRKP
jgi:hypothetical protein